MADRKNQADLTTTERRDFVDAVLQLKRSGRYDEFITTHNGGGATYVGGFEILREPPVDRPIILL